MIVYKLLCSHGHEFEAWFRNGDAFSEQAGAGAVSCPVCGDTKVRKALMAPAIHPSSKASANAPPPPSVEPEENHRASVLQALREIRRQIETGCSYVGENFAEEARKIHYGEVRARGIYGESTPEERQALTEEGVEFGSIPWIPLEN